MEDLINILQTNVPRILIQLIRLLHTSDVLCVCSKTFLDFCSDHFPKYTDVVRMDLCDRSEFSLTIWQ